MKLCNKCQEEKEHSEFTKGRAQCKACRSSANKAWRIKNEDKVKNYNKAKWRERKDNELYIHKRKQWELHNKEKISIDKKEYYKLNKSIIIEKNRLRDIKRREKDPLYKALKNLRRRLNLALKGVYKEETTMKLLGCDLEYFKSYISSLFTIGMSWNNYGYGDAKWHIDHIIPCSSFDLSIKENQVKCFHYTNLQPLWQKDNMSKRNKF